MRSILVVILLCSSFLFGNDPDTELYARWHARTQTRNNGTDVVEKEFLRLNTDHTFTFTILVTLRKKEHFIKDLRIQATGIWKHHDDILVIFIKHVDVPFAKEVSNTISQRSLEQLAGYYNARFARSPILIYRIMRLDSKYLQLRNETGITTVYERSANLTAKPITPPKPVFVNEALRRQHR
jgi:hypothetical protein